MSRTIPGHHHNANILKAAEVWREKCLLANGSLFCKKNLWTSANIEQLLPLIISEITDGNNFYHELELQIKDAPPKVAQLAAEALWLVLLIHSAWGPDIKKRRIAEVWEQSGIALPDSDFLSEATLSGVANPGAMFGRTLHIQMGFLLEMARQWKNLRKTDRIKLIKRHWEFEEWMEWIAKGKKPQIFHVICYFLFPDNFERCVSFTDKKKIVEAFREDCLPENLHPKNKRSSLVEIDRAIFYIREKLEHDYGGEILDFYSPPLEGQWRESKGPLHDINVNSLQSEMQSGQVPFITRSLNTILYGPPGTGKTYATVRHCVEICNFQTPESDEETRKLYSELVGEGQIKFITFHQSYGYEEFVEGLHPATNKNGNNEQTSSNFQLVVKDGVLKRIAKDAQNYGNVRFVLVIDEINRANVSKVLGELVTLLEEDKRQGRSNEMSVQLPYSGEHFTLPSNLYILGTMNTADRSIALLDTALRRRFTFVELPPNPEKLQTAKQVTGINLPAVLRSMNERLEWLIDRDHQIGHAWLMNAKTREDVDCIMRHKIIPLIAEYFYDDWKKVQAVLGGTNDFVKGKRLGPPPSLEDETGEERYHWAINRNFPADAYVKLLSSKPSAEEIPKA